MKTKPEGDANAAPCSQLIFFITHFTGYDFIHAQEGN